LAWEALLLYARFRVDRGDQMIKRIAGLVVIAVLCAGAYTGYRFVTFEAPGRIVAEPDQTPFDGDEIARLLSEAIRFPTISRYDRNVDHAVFDGFNGWFDDNFPRLAALETQWFTHGRVLSWTGSRPELDPILLMGHFDVVPVVAGTESDWTHPPFSGAIADGYVWGRGAIDMKGPTIGLAYALEQLIAAGFKPERTILIALHPDEEVSGETGAVEMAAWLKERGIAPILAVDEGGIISDGLVPGVETDVALIGVGEKGYISLEITAHAPGGHSSTPNAETAVTRLASAITRLKARPFAGGIDGPVRTMYETLAPELSGFQRYLVTNLWLYEPVLAAYLSAGATTNASLRTTIAPTMLEGSPKENVLPATAKATVNLRIHPRDSVESVIAHVERAVKADDITVGLAPGNPSEPAAFSDTQGGVWQAVSQTVASVFPDALVTPSLVLGGTDSRHYKDVAQNIYRFSPLRLDPDMRLGIHGTNERIRIEDLAGMARFYTHLVKRTHGANAFDADK